MAFGREFAKQAQQDQRQRAAQEPRDEEGDAPISDAAVAAVAPSTPAPQSTATPSGRRLGPIAPAAIPEAPAAAPVMAPTPVRARVALAPPAPINPPPAAPSAPVAPPVARAPAARPESFRASVRQDDEPGYGDPLEQGRPVTARGYANLDPSARSRREDQLPLRLEAMIDRVAEHRGLPREQVEQFKAQAARDPEAQTKRFEALMHEVNSAIATQVNSLEEAVAQSPDQVVYLVLKGRKRSLKRASREEAGATYLLHGSIVESVCASGTPFPPPQDVYGRPQELEVATDSEEAFAAPPSEATPRSPRP